MRLASCAMLGLVMAGPVWAKTPSPQDVLTAPEKESIEHYKKADTDKLDPSWSTSEAMSGFFIQDKNIQEVWKKKSAEFCTIKTGLSEKFDHTTDHYDIKIKDVRHHVVIESWLCSNNAFDIDAQDTNGIEGYVLRTGVTVDNQKPYEITGPYSEKPFIYRDALYLTRYGCCGDNSEYTIYDLLSGKVREEKKTLGLSVDEYEERIHD